MIKIKPLTTLKSHQWNTFVNAHHVGTLFHRTEWKNIIEQTFAYKSFYLYAEQDGVIIGVLPLFHVKGVFAGNSLVSTPFAVYGGILTDDESTRTMLADEAKALAHKLGAHYIEFRHQQEQQISDSVTQNSVYATFINQMAESEEAIFENLPKETRRMVRKGRKNGLIIKIDNKRLDEFYEIYARSVRKFGTPVFPKKLFQNCLSILKDNADLLIVESNGTAVAAVLSFYHKDSVLPYYSGMLSESKALAPHNFMYLELMQHARNRGYGTFDFGRSKIGTGAARFKEHMGFEAMPLSYQYFIRGGGELPNRNQTNPKYNFALQMWKRMPLSLTKIIGPHIVKMFP